MTMTIETKHVEPLLPPYKPTRSVVQRLHPQVGTAILQFEVDRGAPFSDEEKPELRRLLHRYPDVWSVYFEANGVADMVCSVHLKSTIQDNKELLAKRVAYLLTLRVTPEERP